MMGHSPLFRTFPLLSTLLAEPGFCSADPLLPGPGSEDSSREMELVQSTLTTVSHSPHQVLLLRRDHVTSFWKIGGRAAGMFLSLKMTWDGDKRSPSPPLGLVIDICQLALLPPPCDSRSDITDTLSILGQKEVLSGRVQAGVRHHTGYVNSRHF